MYYLHAARQANFERAARIRRDGALKQQIDRVWEENFQWSLQNVAIAARRSVAGSIHGGTPHAANGG